MKKLVTFAVDYPVTVLMVTLAVVLLGWISYDKLGVDLFPDLNNPRLYIEVKAGERPPEEMEKRYVKNIESMAIRQRGVVQVFSVCRSGRARITVAYTWNKDMDEAFLDLQKALGSVSQDRDIEELNITRHDPNSAPVMQLALTHDNITDMNRLRVVAQNYIRNELVRLDGIAGVDISGGEEGEVVISTDEYLLRSFGLTLDGVGQRIQAFNRTVSGGSVTEMGKKYIVKGVSLLRNLDDFRGIIVGYKPVEQVPQGQQQATGVTRVPVFLGEVAEISFQNKRPENIVRINGKRCLGLSIYKETRFNTVKAVEQVNKRLQEMEASLTGYHLIRVNDQGAYISNAVSGVKNTALLGIVLAILVLYLFLRRLGVTLIISLAIPVSIIATFNLMYFGGLTLNIMTLGGLALGAGMLVDNAIVVMENIFRNSEAGLDVRSAAVTGTAQVGGAITASTLTTIVVFLPIVYLHGASGELFKDEAWTVAFSLLSSLFVAIFLIPMLYYYIFRNRPVKPTHYSVKFHGYAAVLKKMLRHRWAVTAAALFLVVGAYLLLPFLGMEFMPPADSRQVVMKVTLPEGTTLERTSAALQNLETVIREMTGDDLETLYTHVGSESSEGGDIQAVFQGENNGSVRIVLKKEAGIHTDELIRALGDVAGGVPGMKLDFSTGETALQSILGTSEAPVVVEVQGEDQQVLQQLAGEVAAKMQGVKGLYNIKTSVGEGAPELEVVIDRLRAGIYNLDVATVTATLKNKLTGRQSGNVEIDGEMEPVVMKLPQMDRKALSDLVIRKGNQVVRLAEIADIREAVSPREILRRNQSRIVRITARMGKNEALDKMSARISAALQDIEIPQDYRISITGEEARRKESMGNLGFALLLSIVLVYMVLASQFESLVHPFTILLTIPLAGVGTVLLFLALGRPLDIMALIGVILLAGIAVNDSIILVDRINQLRQEGLPRREAIVEAGRQRIRPILMTSLTTVLALLPLIIGFGENVALRSSMALAVIGGLTTSTLLTLVVIPCFYDILDSLKEMITGKKELTTITRE